MSGYLYSGIGVKAKANQSLLHRIAGVMRNVTGPWVMGADWNCTPEELLATGWPQLVGGTVVRPAGATCGERTLDFFVISNSIAHAVHSIYVVGDATCKTHKPVRLLLKARPANWMVRQMKNIGKFGANLPFGPPNQHDTKEIGSSTLTGGPPPR